MKTIKNMKHVKFLLLIILSVMFNNTLSTAQEVWIKDLNIYGALKKIIKTNDGGYAMLAWEHNTYLIKADSVGNIEWTKEYENEAQYLRCSNFIQTSDSGYILNGSTIYPSSPIIIKTDKYGDTIKTLTEFYAGSFCFEYTPEDSLGFLDSTYPDSTINHKLTKNLELIRIDTIAQYYPSSSSNLACIKKISDDLFFVSSNYITPHNIFMDYNYNHIIEKNYEYNGEIFLTTDGGFFTVGNYEYVYGPNPHPTEEGDLIKYNANFDSLWSVNLRNFYINGYNYMYYDACISAENGDFILSGSIGVWETNNYMFMLRTDSLGNLLWYKQYGAYPFSEVRGIFEAYDGSLFFYAKGSPNYVGMGDLYFVKLRPDGSLDIKETQNSDFKISLSPNPCINDITVKLPEKISGNISILNSAGILVYQNIADTTQTITINTSSFEKGLYFINVYNKINKTNYSQKFIKK